MPPDTEFVEVDFPFSAGEFVWTGFDYLGEPTPYQWRCEPTCSTSPTRLTKAKHERRS